PRPEGARADPVDLDREVVPVGPDQRLTSPELLVPRPLECRQERRRVRRLPQRGPIADFDLGARRAQRPVDPGELRLERGHRPPATIDEMHAHGRELVVPRLELGARGGVSGALLEEPVPPGEELAELEQRLEEVRFALTVRAAEDVKTRRRRQREGAIITKIDGIRPPDLHPLNSCFGRENWLLDPHRHYNTAVPLLLDAFNHARAQGVLQLEDD